jgi:hypothetical protein
VRWWLGFAVACGGSATPPVGNVAPVRPEVPVEVPVGPEDCAARVEDWAPGNHDRHRFEDPLSGKYGFRDGTGAVVIAPQYHFAYEFGPGGVAAVIDAKTPFIYIAPNGKTIANAFASDNGPDYFQEGHARIVDANKKIGFMTDRGTITITPRFDAAESFCHGKARVKLGSEELWIDKRGNQTTPPPK